MKIEVRNCPKCNSFTTQVKAKVPKWRGKIDQSTLREDVTVCLLCGYYIQRKQVLQEKAFDPQHYDLS